MARLSYIPRPCLKKKKKKGRKRGYFKVMDYKVKFRNKIISVSTRESFHKPHTHTHSPKCDGVTFAYKLHTYIF
jgi:hypothetical protein